MRFKPPGYYLGFLSFIWIFGGGSLSYAYAQQGERTLAALFSMFACCAVAIWFNIRWFAIPLMILFGIATLSCVYGLFQPGPWMRAIGKLCIALSSLQSLWEWYSAPDEEDSAAD